MAEVTTGCGARTLERSLVWSAAALITAVTCLSIFDPSPDLGWHMNLVLTQDLGMGVFFAAAFVGAAIGVRVGLPSLRFPASLGHRLVGVASLFAFIVSGAGAVLLLNGFALSHDEFLLVEEANVFLSGRLVADVPIEWRRLIGALQPFYVRVNEDASLLTTGYFPGSAALYAFFEGFGAGALANPAMASGAVLITAQIARRLFPDAPGLAVVSALLLALSTQLLVTGMTPYAMTAHLFLNLAWLSFYMRDDAWGFAGAIGIGAIAISQHQIHIHMLFVLPFLVDLALRRNKWKLVSILLFAYFVTLAGCMAWRGYVLGGPAVNMMIGTTEESGIDFVVSRITLRIAEARSAVEPLLWVTNFFRFVSWQNPVAIPLAIIGLVAIRHAPRELQLLAISLPISLLPYVLLESDPGIGWGFRYLHVHLATFCILAAFGAGRLWRHAGNFRMKASICSVLFVLGIFTAPIVITWRIADMASVVLPYRAVHAELDRIDADVLIVSHAALVKNDFQFVNKPTIVFFPRLKDDDFALLCKNFRVEVIPPALLEEQGIRRLDLTMDPAYADSSYREALTKVQESGCR